MTKCSKVCFNKKILSALRKVLNSSPDKEISGSLRLKKGPKCYSVSVGKYSKGTVEECDLIDTMYNFHTHPREAYRVHGTNVGWPSESDFKTFIYCFFQFKNLLHCVCSLEGIYVITINSSAYNYLMNKPSKQETKQKRVDKLIERIYIDKDLHIDERQHFNGRPITMPMEYVNFVNKEELVKGKPLFKMFFIPWDKPQTITLCNPWKN